MSFCKSEQAAALRSVASGGRRRSALRPGILLGVIMTISWIFLKRLNISLRASLRGWTPWYGLATHQKTYGQQRTPQHSPFHKKSSVLFRACVTWLCSCRRGAIPSRLQGHGACGSSSAAAVAAGASSLCFLGHSASSFMTP